MEPIHFFRAGRHVTASGAAFSFSESDLEAMARQYDPAIHEAPLVVGHPTTDAPAYGWVKSVEARHDGLYATLDRVHPDFSETVRSGAYAKVSGSFYLPDAKTNPRPGTYYLRHIGFLGATPPAIKGLNPISFSDAAETIDFQESQLGLREHRLAIREAAFMEREAARRIQDDADFLQGIVMQGRFPIGLKDIATAVFAELDDHAICFGEGDQQRSASPRALLREMLSLLPVPVAIGEISGGALPTSETTDFSAPEGYTVDEESLAVHLEAVAYQKEHNCTYASAVKAVGLRGR